jgi:hypothetical protein
MTCREILPDIWDVVFSYVNGTNYFYVNKLFFSIVKNRIKRLKVQRLLDYLNYEDPHCPILYDLMDNTFIENSKDFLNINEYGHDRIYSYLFSECVQEMRSDYMLPECFYIAGGSMSTITKWHTPEFNDLKIYNEFDKSDIDIFYIGNPTNAPDLIIKSINELLSIDPRFIVVRTTNTISLYHPTFRTIQFVLHAYSSIHELFTLFDFELVCIAYHRGKLLCEHNRDPIKSNFITLNVMYNYLISRILKYKSRGFNILMSKELPYYTIYVSNKEYNNSEFTNRIKIGSGGNTDRVRWDPIIDILSIHNTIDDSRNFCSCPHECLYCVRLYEYNDVRYLDFKNKSKFIDGYDYKVIYDIDSIKDMNINTIHIIGLNRRYNINKCSNCGIYIHTERNHSKITQCQHTSNYNL